MVKGYWILWALSAGMFIGFGLHASRGMGSPNYDYGKCLLEHKESIYGQHIDNKEKFCRLKAGIKEKP